MNTDRKQLTVDDYRLPEVEVRLCLKERQAVYSFKEHHPELFELRGPFFTGEKGLQSVTSIAEPSRSRKGGRNVEETTENVNTQEQAKTVEKTDKVKEITDRLEAGMKDLFESDRYTSWLRTMSQFHRYSLNNTLLIAMQRPDSTMVAGYQAWQKHFGRQGTPPDRRSRAGRPGRQLPCLFCCPEGYLSRTCQL